MDYFLLNLILFSLIISVILNLSLTLYLFKYVRLLNKNKQDAPPLTLPPGYIIENFKARLINDNKLITLGDNSSVVIFLSEKCRLCRSKVPQLEFLLPAVEKVDVSLWINLIDNVSAKDSFLSESPLIKKTISIDKDLIRTLNPRTAAPFYLLIDHEKELQASGMIGDANWNSFIDQMENILKQNSAEHHE
ncbi:hypothetical protein NJR55_01700 [Idiomarina sp. M1R2S28]|uniref:Thioredoxin domain-containing protein n=1 Tax=Idiomarina rhizosphaerae TaxID=2961572 RepID=A0A9X2FTK2_9GAMM|nr:hypothetical protein [Idiomarina rhizosphaerae]MCP1338297.1 hypothetical protein [Idiomarina rhizosphaerae]